MSSSKNNTDECVSTNFCHTYVSLNLLSSLLSQSAELSSYPDSLSFCHRIAIYMHKTFIARTIDIAMIQSTMICHYDWSHYTNYPQG